MNVNISYKDKNAPEGARFNNWEIEFSQLHTMTQRVTYSHLIWQDGHRKADNFVSTNMLILDFDSTRSLEEMKDYFKGTNNVLIVT